MARRTRRPARARSTTSALVLLLAALCLAACQADVTVAVAATGSGGGSVTVTVVLDREAAAYASAVDFSDLVQADWSVTGPKPAANGAVAFVAARSFSTPAQAQALIAQLSGTSGPFHGLSLVSHRTFFSSSTTFGGAVNLACGLDCFADPQLRAALGGSPNLGIDPTTLHNDAGIDVGDLVSFQLVARLPGKVASNAPDRSGGFARWSLPLGKNTVVMASSHAWNVTHLVVVAVAGLVLVVAVVLGLLRLVRRRPRHAHSRR